LYGCRECDHDLCQRCMSTQAGVKPPDPAGADLDALDAEEAMTRDDFNLANASSPEERRELILKKRAAQDGANAEREQSLAAREAFKAKEAAERLEEVTWAKYEAKEKRKVESENDRDTTRFNRREAARKKEDKLAIKERKKLDATRVLKEKEEEKLVKGHDRAKAKVDNAVNRGRSLPAKELDFLHAEELGVIMDSGYLSSKDQALVETAHAVAEARESEAVLYKARMVDAEKRLREEQIERDTMRKEEAVELKALVDARRAELALEREERKQEMDVVRKGYGVEAAELADEKARAEIKVDDEKRKAQFVKRDEKKMQQDALFDAKMEVQQMKVDKEHSAATAKARAAEHEKKKNQREALDKEHLGKALEDLDKGKGLNFDSLTKMTSWTITDLLEAHGIKMSPEEVAEAEDAAAKKRKEEAREELRQAALEKAEDALQKQYLKESAEEEKRKAKEEEAEAKYEVKRAAEVAKAIDDELKAEARIEAAEIKRGEENQLKIAKLEEVSAANEEARNEVLRKKRAEDEARVASTEKALAGIREALKEKVPLSSGALDLLTTSQLKELRDEGSSDDQGAPVKLGPEDDALCAEAGVKAARFEKNESLEAGRREARFSREKAHELEMLELGRKRVLEGERRWKEEGERDAKARKEKTALRDRRAQEKQAREDEKASRLARIATKQEVGEVHLAKVKADSAKGKPVDIDALADLPSMLLGDCLEVLILKEGEALSTLERDRVDEMLVAIVEQERVERQDMEDLESDEGKRLKRVRARESAEWRAAGKSALREEMLEARLASAEKKEEETELKKVKCISVAAVAKEECERLETEEMAARVEAEDTKRAFVSEQMKRVEKDTALRKETHLAEVSSSKEAQVAINAESKEYIYGCLEEGETNLSGKYIRHMGSLNIKELLASGKLDEASEDKAKDALLDATSDEEGVSFASTKKFTTLETSAAVKEDKLYKDMAKKAEASANKLLAQASKSDASWKKAEHALSRATVSHASAVKRVEDAVNAKVRNINEAEDLKRTHAGFNDKVKQQEELEHEQTLRRREADRNAEAELRALKALKEREQKFRKRKDAENMAHIDAALARSQPLDFNLLPPMGSVNLSELLQCGILSSQEQERVAECLVEATAREHEEKAFYVKMEKDAEEAMVRKRKEAVQQREDEEKRLRKDEKHHQKLEDKLIKAQRSEDDSLETKNRLQEEASELRIQANEASEAAEAARLEAAERRLTVKEELRRKKVVEKEKRRQEYEQSHEEEKTLSLKREAASMRKVEKDLKNGRALNPAMVPLVGPRNLTNLVARGVLRGDDVKLAEKTATEQNANEGREREERERRRLVGEVQVTAALQTEERNVRQACSDLEWKAEERAKTLDSKATKKEAEAKKAEVEHQTKAKAQVRAAAANETKRKAESKREEVEEELREFEISVQMKRRKSKQTKEDVDHEMKLGKPLDHKKLPFVSALPLSEVLFNGAESSGPGGSTVLTPQDREALEREIARAKKEEAADLATVRKFEDAIREADAEAGRLIAAEEATQRKMASAERREAEATMKFEGKRGEYEVLHRKSEALNKHAAALKAEGSERVREDSEAADEERDEKLRLEDARLEEDKQFKTAASDSATERIDKDLKRGDPVSSALFLMCPSSLIDEYLSSGKLTQQRDIDEAHDAKEEVEEVEEKDAKVSRHRRDAAVSEAEAKKKAAGDRAELATKKADSDAAKAQEVAAKAKEALVKAEEERDKKLAVLQSAEGRLKAAEEGRDKLEADAKALQVLDFELVNMVEDEGVPLGPSTLKALETQKGGKSAKRRMAKELEKKQLEVLKLEDKVKEQQKHLEAAQKAHKAAEAALEAKSAEIKELKNEIDGKPADEGVLGSVAGGVKGGIGNLGNKIGSFKK